jgi:hypothetical protein
MKYIHYIILVLCIQSTKRIAFGYVTEMRSFAFKCLIRKFDVPHFQVGKDFPADKTERATPYNVQHGTRCKPYFTQVEAHPLAKILIGFISKMGVTLNCSATIFT